MSGAPGGEDALDPEKPGLAVPGEPYEGVELVSDLWPRADDGLQLRGGGVVAVDTATLRDAAGRFGACEAELASIGEQLGRLQNMMFALGGGPAQLESSVWSLGSGIQRVQTEATAIATALREAALAYEIVELQAEHRAAVLAGDDARAERLERRIDGLADEHPEAWQLALGAQFDRAVMWPGELVRQSTQWGVGVGSTFSGPGGIVLGAAGGLLTLGGAAFLGFAGTGRLPRDTRLTGTAGPVSVISVAPVAPTGAPSAVGPAAAPGASGAAVPASAPVAGAGAAGAVGAGGAGGAGTGARPAAVAPQSLAAVTERMPGAGDSRVRVERYTMGDGSAQYAVYIAGMQSFAIGGDDPWDNASNLELYSGRVSDSYAATEAALAAAGAQPGDVVHAFGHSQGAMIGAHLALEGDYDVQTLVSLGSPVEADVGPRTLSVALRHTDDPVAALAGGGHGESVGAPGSFVAERVSDPDADLDDVRVPAHRMTAYAETAAMVDASTDPRVDGLRDVFGRLAEADAVEVTEYAAVRGEG